VRCRGNKLSVAREKIGQGWIFAVVNRARERGLREGRGVAGRRGGPLIYGLIFPGNAAAINPAL